MTAATDRPMLLGCESCGLVSPAVAPRDEMIVQECPRCGHDLVATKPHAVQRTGRGMPQSPQNYFPSRLAAPQLGHSMPHPID